MNELDLGIMKEEISMIIAAFAQSKIIMIVMAMALTEYKERNETFILTTDLDCSLLSSVWGTGLKMVIKFSEPFFSVSLFLKLFSMESFCP